MQFIRLPKLIDILERVLPELVADWVDTWSVQSFNNIVLQQLGVYMLVSWAFEHWKWLNLHHQRTFSHFTHQAWAIWDLSKHNLIWIIPDHGSQQTVTFSLQSICTIPFQARGSDVKMPELRQHSSNHIMTFFINDTGTVQGTSDQSIENPGKVFGSPADIFLNITNRETQQPGMLKAQNIAQVSHVQCTYDWHNCHSSRTLILCIPPPIAPVHLAVDSTTLRVSEAHWCKVEVCLIWEKF